MGKIHFLRPLLCGGPECAILFLRLQNVTSLKCNLPIGGGGKEAAVRVSGKSSERCLPAIHQDQERSQRDRKTCNINWKTILLSERERARILRLSRNPQRFYGNICSGPLDPCEIRKHSARHILVLNGFIFTSARFLSAPPVKQTRIYGDVNSHSIISMPPYVPDTYYHS